MGRHLTAARRRVGFGSHGLEQHVFGGHPESQAQGAVAIVGKEPIVAGLEHHAGGGLNGLVSGAGDLKIDFALALEKDLPVVDAAGEVHDAESMDEFVAPETRGSERPKCQVGDSACHERSVIKFISGARRQGPGAGDQMKWGSPLFDAHNAAGRELL